MELIMQPTFSTCGQTCIAMITGKSVEEVIKDMKIDGATSIGQLIEKFRFFRSMQKLLNGEQGHALTNIPSS